MWDCKYHDTKDDSCKKRRAPCYPGGIGCVLKDKFVFPFRQDEDPLLKRKKQKKLNHFTFKAKVWLYKGPAAWHFVTIPKKESDTIKSCFGEIKRGWGSIPVEVKVKSIKWETSIFPDKKAGAYLLPLKKEIRNAAKISKDDVIEMSLTIRY